MQMAKCSITHETFNFVHSSGASRGRQFVATAPQNACGAPLNGAPLP